MAKGNGASSLESTYEKAQAKWDAAYAAGFPDGDRAELAAARDEAFEAWDHAAWVAKQEEAGFTVAADGRTVIEGPEPTVHDDGTVS